MVKEKIQKMNALPMAVDIQLLRFANSKASFLCILALFNCFPFLPGIYTIRAVQPKYRSLGAPIPVVPIPGIDDNPSLLLGPRGAPEGAADFDSFVPTIGTGKGLLENFSVRTLYDKLEDQSLHMTSQLARHQSDLRGFYDRICQQTEGLKQMLASLDVSLLAKATENAAKIKANAGIEREGKFSLVFMFRYTTPFFSKGIFLDKKYIIMHPNSYI